MRRYFGELYCRLDVQAHRIPAVPRNLGVTALFLCAAYSGMHPLLSILALILLLSVPWLLYRRLSATAAAVAKVRTVPLWTEGIYSFLFGGLIMALLVYMWLRFVDPGYVHNQLELAAQLMREYPQSASHELRHAVEAVLEQGSLPGAIQMAMSLFWTVTFTGAVLSLPVAFIIAKIKSSR